MVDVLITAAAVARVVFSAPEKCVSGERTAKCYLAGGGGRPLRGQAIN